MLAVILKILGIEAIPIGGEVSLKITESLFVNLHWHASTHHLILFSEIASLDQFEMSVELLMVLMEANCFWSGTSGATLCIEKEENTLLLIHKIHIDEQFLSENNIKGFFEGFFNAASFWYEQFSLFSQESAVLSVSNSQEKTAAFNLGQQSAYEHTVSLQATMQNRA